MNLLDLPAEIFAAIIHNYLHDYLYNGRGWAVAVRARYVCKAFAVAIHDDMFGRYSASFYRSFSDDRKQRLLAPNMYTVLSKMGPTRCRSTYILDHMEATVDFLMEFSYYQSQAQRERYRLALCNAMSAALSVDDILAYLCQGPFNDSVKVRKNMGRADTVGMLAAAAAVNSEPALRFLVGKVYDVGLRSELYGTPLTAAAVNGHLYSASFIYERMEKRFYKRKQLHNAINACMFEQRTTILPTLMSWYLKHCYSGRLIKEAKRGWIDWAVRNGEMDVLRFSYYPEDAINYIRRLEPTPFHSACRYGHTHIIQYLLQADPTLRCAIRNHEKSYIGPNELWQGLTVAVENGWLVATRLLIRSGVQITQGNEHYVPSTPVLWYALKGGHIDMVVLLLAYGAVVPKRSSERNGIWNMAANHSVKTARLLQDIWDEQERCK